MFARLVTGRYYGIASEGETRTEQAHRTSFLRRIIAVIFGRKA
jgi:hypothetical protein